jgi:hypothetical protein
MIFKDLITKVKEHSLGRDPLRADAPWVALESVGHLGRLQSSPR